MPFDPRHASQDSCCRSNFGQVDGSFFVRRKRAIVRVNESCGGDVAVVRGTGAGGLLAQLFEGWLLCGCMTLGAKGPSFCIQPVESNFTPLQSSPIALS